MKIVADETPWLTDRQLEDLRSQILRQPNRTLNLSVATFLPISYIGRNID